MANERHPYLFKIHCEGPFDYRKQSSALCSRRKGCHRVQAGQGVPGALPLTRLPSHLPLVLLPVL